jgi:predicted nucleotidyltransferase
MAQNTLHGQNRRSGIEQQNSCFQFDYVLTAGYTGLMKTSTVAGNIKIPGDQIAAFCRRHYIRRLALFGSALRDDFEPHSDLDVLVEFEPGHIPGLAFFTIQEELSRLLGRPVDLNTLQFISPRFRQEVQAEAEVIYDQT